MLALFSLALGLSPLLSSFKKNLIVTRAPGTETLELKQPGLYMGIGVTKGIPSQDTLRVDDLEYSLVDEDGQLVQAFMKIPRRQYASDNPVDQIPLFQFEIEKKGKYSFLSNYPYNMAGPQIQIYLVHSDLSYNRVELGVGILLFFAFGGLGFYFIRKSYKASSAASKKSA